MVVAIIAQISHLDNYDTVDGFRVSEVLMERRLSKNNITDSDPRSEGRHIIKVVWGSRGDWMKETNLEGEDDRYSYGKILLSCAFHPIGC